MRSALVGLLMVAAAVGSYFYWPEDASSSGLEGRPAPQLAAATAGGTTEDKAKPSRGAPTEPSAEAQEVDTTPEAILARLKDTAQALREVHSIQAELQELKEGSKARAIREALDRTAAEARRRGQALVNEDPVGAWRELSLAYFATTDARVRADLKPALDALSSDLILSKKKVEGLSTQVQIPPGGTLVGIAKAHKTYWRLIAKANGISDPRRIRAGDQLKVPTGSVEVFVRKRSFLLLATYDGGYLRSYEVGTGKQDRTPETVFKITEAEIDPTWYGPDGVYPFGHEKNILGTRWMGFNRDQYSGFGIHGTPYPETIGTESSAGCIRMRNPEVEELFDLLGLETKITITK